MILVGQYDSPFVRRVAISLLVLGIDFKRDTRSVFGDFAAMRARNPLVRIPSLILDDGETLIDSFAILDWLDELVGPDRALMPPSGEARRLMMQRVVLATGAVEKAGAAAYERIIRPSPLRWSEWIERCHMQAAGALALLEQQDWPDDVALDQAQITTACLVAYVRMVDPVLMPEARYPKLLDLSDRCEARPEFIATRVTEYAVPHAE
jgi:glutathione S-transferase